MTTTKTTNGHAAVSIIKNGDSGFIAHALLCDSANYGGDSFWYGIGHYKTVKNAQRASVKAMARHGYDIIF